MKIDQLKPHNKAKPLKPTTTLNGAEVETWDVVAQSPVSKRVRVGVCVCDRERGGEGEREAPILMSLPAQGCICSDRCPVHTTLYIRLLSRVKGREHRALVGPLSDSGRPQGAYLLQLPHVTHFL